MLPLLTSALLGMALCAPLDTDRIPPPSPFVTCGIKLTWDAKDSTYRTAAGDKATPRRHVNDDGTHSDWVVIQRPLIDWLPSYTGVEIRRAIQPKPGDRGASVQRSVAASESPLPSAVAFELTEQEKHEPFWRWNCIDSNRNGNCYATKQALLVRGDDGESEQHPSGLTRWIYIDSKWRASTRRQFWAGFWEGER